MTQPLLADIYAAALSVGERPATLRLWVHRGRLTHHGYDSQRRVLVDLHELQALIHQKRHTTAPRVAA
ncbi:hypothetical protein [Streptomyces sp. NPDC055210]